MKEQELRTLSQCCICNRKIAQLPIPLFHKVIVERFALNINAVRRQAGMEAITGSPVLAMVMGPNEDMATSFGSATVMICDGCALEKIPEVFVAMEEQDNG